ncbi:hypothetical protein ACFLX7_00490 [Chloroflexota bacterium]
MDIRKLKGGAKHKYLRENRREILAYLSTHGESKTLRKYVMRVETLDRLISDSNITRQERVSDIDKATLRIEILQESVNSLNRDVRALESSFSVPVEELADSIRNHVVVPLLKMVQRPGGLELKRENKLLDIGSFLDDAER